MRQKVAKYTWRLSNTTIRTGVIVAKNGLLEKSVKLEKFVIGGLLGEKFDVLGGGDEGSLGLCGKDRRAGN